MADYIELPVGEEHIKPIVKRKDEVVSKVESILPKAKVEKVTRRFNEKLEEIRQIFRDCDMLKTKLREMSPLEQVFLEMGDVAGGANVSINYARCPKKNLVAEERLPTAEVNTVPVVNTATVEMHESKENAIICPVTLAEFELIPKYMRGRMALSELNDIVGKLDEFLTMKRNLLNTSFKKLSMKDKDQVSKWREQEPAPITGQLYCQEVDVKPFMKDRSKALFRTAMPCLRHVRRVREVRVKGKVYLLPGQ